jgi:protein required for attachment to host cells
MQTIWIVAADNSRAKVFQVRDASHEVDAIQEFSNPEARTANRQLVSDAQGRFAGKGTNERGHTIAPHLTAVEHENVVFAKTVADFLNKARAERRFDKLHLIAAPKFLGLLRKEMRPEVQKTVAQEIPKEVTSRKGQEIEDYIVDWRMKIAR